MPTAKQPGRHRLELIAEPAFLDLVARAAAKATGSVSSYVRLALMERMERDGFRWTGVAAKRRGRPT